MGRGRGRGQQFDGPGGPPGRGPGGFNQGQNFQDETRYSIPAEKCGLVIGKGNVFSFKNMLPSIILVMQL